MSSNESKIINWIDMSAYGIYFGVIDMPNGERRAVMVDENEAHTTFGRQIGFQESARIPGVWFKVGENFSIPAKVLKGQYPLARPVKISEAERTRNIKAKLSQANTRMLNAQKSGQAPGWKPGEKVTTQAAPVQAEKTMPLSVAVNQTLYCGVNAHGHDVFELADGSRYMMSNNRILAREEVGQADASNPEFLRAAGADDADGLIGCAKGMLAEMRKGKMRSREFSRYINAVLGPDSDKDEARISAFQRAIDHAIIDAVRNVSDSDDRFVLARQLQEMRPSFFRPDGSHPTPAPIASILQEIFADKVGEHDAVLGFNGGIEDQHTWLLPSDQISQDGQIVPHRFAVGGIFSQPIDEEDIAGIRVDRADHAAILKSLALRDQDGVSVFFYACDEEAGKVSPASRRMLSLIGSQYEIAGLVDIDATVIGEGVKTGSRMIVIGARKAQEDHAFAPPAKLPVMYEFDEIRSFAKDVVGSDFREVENFGESRVANRLQVPYIPHSQISEPKSMSPKNLLGPTRRALSALVGKVGMSVDDFVASKLQISLEHLSSGILNAEQVDAIALGINAIDEKRALIVADMAGVGKGRVLAALAAYSVLSGKKAMFLTEKSELYADFYRDLRDIGMDKVMGTPFLLNTSGGVTTMDGADTLFPASSREDILQLVRKGGFPEGRNFVMASYSIFNREAATESDLEFLSTAEEAARKVREGVPFDEVPNIYHLLEIGGEVSSYRMKLVDDAGEKLSGGALMAKLNEIANYDVENIAPESRMYSRDNVDLAKRELRLRNMRPRLLANEVLKAASKPLNAWRGLWASRASSMEDVVLLLDESHNAAGMSNTGVNIGEMARAAHSCVYSSATFAKQERDFGVYTRAFPDSISHEEISSIIAHGGEPLREILTGMLAEDGLLIRREHDWGDVSTTVAHDASRAADKQEKKDALADVLMRMALLSGSIARDVRAKNQTAKALAAQQPMASPSQAKKAGTLTYSYSGPFSRFYSISRAFSFAVGVDNVVDLALDAHRANKKPVLTIESTMESVLLDLARMVGTEEDESGRIRLGKNLDFRDLMHRYATNMFNVYEVRRVGRRVVSKKKIASALPGMEKDVQEIHDLIDKLPADIPLSPIDVMRERIEAAGLSFAEVSGRKFRLSVDENGEQYLERIQNTGKGTSVKYVDDFNSGRLDVMLLSTSGSTGISLQSAVDFPDQRQRRLIEAQPASDIRDRFQFWGRVFRTGQVCPPEYVLPSSGLAHDIRLQMIQNTSSRKMSASVSGNSDNMMLDDNVPDIMNEIGNQVCLNWLETRPDIAMMMGINLNSGIENEDDESDAEAASEEQASGAANDKNAYCGTGFVDKLTGRLFMLSSKDEEAAWNEIFAEYKAVIEQYEAQGYNPLESSVHDIRAKRLSSSVFESSQGDENNESIFARPVLATELQYEASYPALDVKSVQEEIRVALQAFDEKTDGKGHSFYEEKIRRAFKKSGDSLAIMSGFPSLEAAMASDRNNRVKMAASRSHTHLSILRALSQPGNVIWTNRMGEPKEFVVLDISAPAQSRDIGKMSMWKVRLLDVETRRTSEVSMASLASSSGNIFSEGPKKLGEMLEIVSKHSRKTLTRVALEGNLFLAAQVSNRMKRGEPVSYTDEKGVWHQAFMMPLGMSLRDVMREDIQIRDEKLAYDLLHDEVTKGSVLANSFAAADRVYGVYRRDDGGILIETGKPSRKAEIRAKSIILRDEKLKELSIDGKSVGERGLRRLVYSPDNALEALKRIIELGATTGHPMCASSQHRDWIEARRINQTKRASEDLKLNDFAAQLGI